MGVERMDLHPLTWWGEREGGGGQDGTFCPWEIYNVLPCDDRGRPCHEGTAQRLLADAKQCSPGVLFVMTTEPQLPTTDAVLTGQCSPLY